MTVSLLPSVPHSCLCAHFQARGQSLLGVTLQELSTLVLETGSLTGLEVPAGLGTHGIQLPLPPTSEILGAHHHNWLSDVRSEESNSGLGYPINEHVWPSVASRHRRDISNSKPVVFSSEFLRFYPKQPISSATQVCLDMLTTREGQEKTWPSHIDVHDHQ